MIREGIEKRSNLKNWILARIIAVLLRGLCATVRTRINGESAFHFLSWVDQHKGAVLITWHGRVLLPIIHLWGRGKAGYHMLVSLSNDGDFVTEFLRAAGLKVIRGSTSRRGAVAAREAVALLTNGGVLACSPDGPRGPAYVAQLGVVYVARKSGKPIIPVGIASWPRWELRSWDKFVIPKPFARCEWVIGDPIFVNEEESLEETAKRVAEIMNRLQEQAEAMVVSEKRGAVSKSRTMDTT